MIGDCIWVQSLANGLYDQISPIKNDLNIPFALGFKNEAITSPSCQIRKL